MRANILLALFIVGVFAPVARAADYQASTAAFSITGGYSAVVGSSPASVSQQTHHYAGNGPIDVFYSVANSGNAVLHSFTVGVANFTGSPIVGYEFELGTTTQDYYHNINIDGDAFADYLDTDDDADGVADVNDNVPWVVNNQADADNDGWGDVGDVQPNVTLIPLAYGGPPVPDPRLPVPTTLGTLGSHPGMFFAGTPSGFGFPNVTMAGDLLQLIGGAIPPDAASTFTFSVSVPDNLAFNGFVLRQTAVVPEPMSGAAGLLIVTYLVSRRSTKRA